MSQCGDRVAKKARLSGGYAQYCLPARLSSELPQILDDHGLHPVDSASLHYKGLWFPLLQ